MLKTFEEIKTCNQMHKMFNKCKEDVIKQVKDVTNKMFHRLKEETNNKLTELNKTIQDMSDHPIRN